MSKPTIVLNIQTLIGGIVVVNASDSNSVEKISNAVEEALVTVMSRIHEPAELGNESKKGSNEK